MYALNQCITTLSGLAETEIMLILHNENRKKYVWLPGDSPGSLWRVSTVCKGHGTQGTQTLRDEGLSPATELVTETSRC